MSSPPRRVVVAGASGFVGRHLVDRLLSDGDDVGCGARDPVASAGKHPGRDWVALDVDREETLDRALEGADSAVFLVHRLRDADHDIERLEEGAATRFLRAAERHGVRRIVYLGGPSADSPHLRARVRTGEVLRSGRVSTIELRAGMVVGAGSESWTIVRDLALRLPVMVLPRWMKSRSQPIWIGDVAAALAYAVSDDLVGSAWFSLPGPETLTAEQMLVRVAAHVGMRPARIRVPVLTPRLSSHWIRLFSRADYTVARQLVDGLGGDLIAPDDGYWLRAVGIPRTSFDEAVDRALADEPPMSGGGAAWERLARRLSRKV